MIQRLRSALRRFRRNEEGSIYTVEFVIGFPLLMMLLVSAWEIGIYAYRQHWLDRGLDLAVRDVRLSTGANYSHAQVKQMICDEAGFLTDCNANLKLEMKTVDPRNFVPFDNAMDCRDSVDAEIEPSRVFVHGNSHDLMVLRACYLYNPLFPHIGMGEQMKNTGDESGYSGKYPMYSVSVFVQEPNS